MSITVLAKKDCPQCVFLSKALDEADLEYLYLDVDNLIDIYLEADPATRMEILEARARCCMANEELPIVVFDGRAEDFKGGLKVLGIDYAPDECEGGVCKLGGAHANNN